PDNSHRMHDRTSWKLALAVRRYTVVVGEARGSGAADDLSQTDLDERRMQPNGQRCELAHRLFGTRLGLTAALPRHRADHLREETDLALGSGPERPQVPSF